MKIESIVRSVMIVIAVAIVAFIINNLGTTYMKNQSIDGCIEASKTTIVNTDASSWTGNNEG